MSLREQIAPYGDHYGLISSAPVAPGVLIASGNGVLYTSEYYIMLARSAKVQLEDSSQMMRILGACIDNNGLLHRQPVAVPTSNTEAPDDYYGILAACSTWGWTSPAKGFLRALWRYKGCLNDVSPGTWTSQSFLARQPQLVAAMIAAAYPGKTLKERLIRLAAFPLFCYAALVIATSCIRADKSDTDARFLAWLLIQSVSPVSFLCNLASKVWFRRLYATYGWELGMKAVCSLYFSPGHPFNIYWID